MGEAGIHDDASGGVLPVAPGDILAGKYRVDRILGKGGMGVVVAATHIDLLEMRAIKFLLPGYLGNAEAVQRFLREARALARLKGEHVAKVHDVGKLENGAPYMIMEYLTGADLGAEVRRRGALPVHEAALYVVQACEGLAEAHAAGIIHRDLKPENLFLAKGPGGIPSIKVLDFGISSMGGGEHEMRMTNASVVMGSPYYMSPEQTRSLRDADTRADIWSLGVILYELVTGTLPFKGQNLNEILTAVMFGELARPSTVAPDVPEGLDRIIVRCLERELDRRYASVAELAEDLAPFAPAASSRTVQRISLMLPRSPPGHPSLRGEDSLSAGTISGGFRSAQQAARLTGPSRTPALMIAAGVALAMAFGGAAFFLGRGASSRPPAEVVQAGGSLLPPVPASIVVPAHDGAAGGPIPRAPAEPTPTPSISESPITVTPSTPADVPPPSARPAPSAPRPAGKGPARPGATGVPKRPSTGDPFGDGRL